MKAALAPFVLAAACGCPRPQPPRVEPTPDGPPAAPAPLGRARAGAPACPHGEPERFALDVFWPRLDPGTYIDEDHVDNGPPTPAERERLANRPWGIHLCGAWEGLAGAEMVACRDPGGRFHGPVEMIATDRSILVQGWCEHGAPLGLWLSWRADRLVRIHSFTQQASRGLQFYDPSAGPDLYNGVPVSPGRAP